jgi:hypothetical protein
VPDLVIDALLRDYAGEFDLRPAEAVNLAGQETGRRTLSHSTLNLWLACPQKFGWAKAERLEPIKESRALSLGRAFHYGIEANSPQAALDFLIRESGHPSSQDEQDQLETNATIVYASAEAYLEKWPAPVNEAREVEYVVRIRNPWTGSYSRTFDLRGYADGVIDNGDHLELVERKLVGQVSAVSRKKLYLDRQISLACYGLWRATGKPVKVVRYRYVKKPSIRRKQNESQRDFIQRLHDDYRSRPDFYVPEFDPVFRDERDLLRAEAELWRWASDIREGIQAKFFTRNTTHCSDFGGCEFLPLCMGEQGAESLYRVRPEPTTTTTEGTPDGSE